MGFDAGVDQVVSPVSNSQLICVKSVNSIMIEPVKNQVLSRLLYLMRVVDRSSQQIIALALAHLCSADDQKSIFVDSSGPDCLLELLASPDLRSQRLGSVALYKLASCCF